MSLYPPEEKSSFCSAPFRFSSPFPRGCCTSDRWWRHARRTTVEIPISTRSLGTEILININTKENRWKERESERKKERWLSYVYIYIHIHTYRYIIIMFEKEKKIWSGQETGVNSCCCTKKPIMIMIFFEIIIIIVIIILDNAIKIVFSKVINGFYIYQTYLFIIVKRFHFFMWNSNLIYLLDLIRLVRIRVHSP